MVPRADDYRMPYMVESGTTTEGHRVRCPGDGCRYELLEPEWTATHVSDHCCPDGHWFRVKGDDFDDVDVFNFYEIEPTDIQLENCR